MNICEIGDYAGGYLRTVIQHTFYILSFSFDLLTLILQSKVIIFNLLMFLEFC